VRPHADDLYLGVAVALAIDGAVVAAILLRRFVRRPLVGGAAVAVMVLLVLALEPRRGSDVGASKVVDAGDVGTEGSRRTPPSALVPAPPAMRQVPIPPITAAPAPPVSRAPRPTNDRATPPSLLSPRPPPSPSTSSPTSVPPIVTLPPVPTTVTVTTTTIGDH
jgi:hypothetical protein